MISQLHSWGPHFYNSGIELEQVPRAIQCTQWDMTNTDILSSPHAVLLTIGMLHYRILEQYKAVQAVYHRYGI